MKKYTPLIVMFAIIMAAQAIYWVAVSQGITDANARGVFGDSFGGLTSLFSGFAFAGMIYAIIMQSKELELQREELALTRQELAASREEQAKAAAAQEELVEKQVMSSRIQGMAAIVQGRYQYASSHGANANRFVNQAHAVENQLMRLMIESGMEELDLPPPDNR